MAKNFYRSCLDVSALDALGLEPLEGLLKYLDVPLPMMDIASSSQNINLNKILKSILMHLFADSGLFGLDVEIDLHDAQHTNLLVVYQPSFRFPKEVYNATMETKASEDSQAECPKDDIDCYGAFLLQAYGEYLANVALDFYAYVDKDKGPSSLFESLFREADTMQKLATFIAVEKALSNITIAEESLSFEESIQSIPFSEFKDAFKADKDSHLGLDIPQVIAETLSELIDFALTDDTLISVPHLGYFQSLGQVLNRFSNEELANYLVFRQVLDLSQATTAQMRLYHKKFLATTQGSWARQPRPDHCLSTTIYYFGAKVSQMMIREYDGEAIKVKVTEIIENIKGAFRDTIKRSDWIDKETKMKALYKLAAIKPLVVHSDSILNRDVEALYRGVPEKIESDAYFSNLLAMQRFWTWEALSALLREPRFEDLHDRNFDTTLVNAMYMPFHNAIWVPLGILDYKVYKDHSLAALNYGAIGSIIGHELTHGFDNIGAKFDQDGNLNNWWTNATYEAFVDKHQCLIDQYGESKYPVLENLDGYDGPTSVDGAATLGENIADNGGIKEAFKAYKNFILALYESPDDEPALPGLTQFSGDQLFFISYGMLWCEKLTLQSLVSQLKYDPHPPGEVRVTKTLQNMPEFQKAFNCANNNKMVPKERCSVW